jgi:putative ABC transport system permease protein
VHTTALAQDLRFALRMLAKRPGYAVALILVLALGIGGTSALFTIVDGVVIQTLPFKNPDQLVVIGGAERIPNGDSLAWWGQGNAFSSLAEYGSGGVNFSSAGRSERIYGTTVSGSFFPLLGIGAQLGRTFSTNDETPDRSEIVILSHRFWARAFGSDRDAPGRVLALNGNFYTIVGVMPPGFGYPGHTDVWVPRRGSDINAIRAVDLGSDKQPDLPAGLQWAMLGRLRDDVALPQANVELRGLLQLESKTFHPERRGAGMFIHASPLQELFVRDVRTSLFALFGAVAFLLLIACVNVANMILVRAAARQKEIAVRLCLGASRARILCQMLTESTLLAALGGTAGILLAFWSVRVIQLLGPKDVPRLADIHLDFRALGFAVGLSLLTGVLVGLAPALQAVRHDLTRALKQDSARPTGALRKRLRGAFVVVEVALTLALLMGAGVMIRSLDNLLRTSPGFAAQNVISMEFALPVAKYLPARATAAEGAAKQQPDFSRVAGFYQRLSEELAQLPGVSAVGVVNRLPLGGKSGGGLYLEAGSFRRTASAFDVSGDYFQAMGIPILAGRGFTAEDLRSHADVIVINQTMARMAWPGENSLGKIVKSGSARPPREVIGVVSDVKFEGLGEKPEPQYYLPAQALNMTLVVRASSDPRALIAGIRERVRQIDADVPLFNVRTMNEVIADSTSAPRFRGIVVGISAGLALALAVFGCYSVVAYSVTRRTHEMGVRMSLGAQPRDILVMVTGEGARLALAGIVLGALLSLWLNKLVAGLLYGVSPADPATLTAAAAILAACTLLASLLPALRASRIDPASALRHE